MQATWLGLVVETLRLRLHAVHAYIDQQAAYLSDSAGAGSRPQMQVELSAIYSLVSYFNGGQYNGLTFS